jgi:hypothetical protein
MPIDPPEQGMGIAIAPSPAPPSASQPTRASVSSAVFEQQVAEMIAAFDRGERPRAEDLLARMPKLAYV